MHDALHRQTNAIEQLQTLLVDYQKAQTVQQQDACWTQIVATTSPIACRRVNSLAAIMRGSVTSTPQASQIQRHPWLYLNHYSGYVRQQALRQIELQPTQLPNAVFGVLLLGRLNDWVNAVRIQAQRTLQAKLTQPASHEYAPALVWLLGSWQHWGRQAAAEREAVLRLLVQTKVLNAVLTYLQQEATNPIAKAFQQLAPLPFIDHRLWELATTARQPLIRLQCYRCLFKQQIQWVVGYHWQLIDRFTGERRWSPRWENRPLTYSVDQLEILQQMVQDKAALVRRQAGALLIEIADTEPRVQQLTHVAQQLAADPSPAVAYRGEFALRELKKNPAANTHC